MTKSKMLYEVAGMLMVSVYMFIASCSDEKNIATGPVLSAEEILHEQQDQLTQVIIYDVFTPPVASRIYAYTSLAAYEAVRYLEPGQGSLVDKMRGFGKMPEPAPGKSYNYILAAHRAFITVAHKVVFSVDSLTRFEQAIDGQFRNKLPEDEYNNSVEFGEAIGKAVLQRAMEDNYLKSRGKPKYLGSEEPGKWRPTPPDYMDGVEFCWNEMKTLLMDSAGQFLPPPPPAYSMKPGSRFYKEVMDVYETGNRLTADQKDIAKFWDDNPFVVQHSGHLMMANKKITPGGHWMGIAAIASKMTKADPVKTAKTYAMTATALFEGFISSWDAKYKWSYIRPVTVINEYIDKTWTPLLQTPPFPEYTSAHSTITATAATVLTRIYGDNFSFQDTSDLRYIGMQRHFDSFLQASDQTSISRFYGGIHYRVSVDEGAAAGRRIGQYIIEKTGL